MTDRISKEMLGSAVSDRSGASLETILDEYADMVSKAKGKILKILVKQSNASTEVYMVKLASAKSEAEKTGKEPKRVTRIDNWSINKPALQDEFGLSSRQINSIVKKLIGMIKSRNSNNSNYIYQTKEKLEQNRQKIKRNNDKRLSVKRQNTKDKYWRIIRTLHNRRTKLKNELREYKSGQIRITLGSHRLWKAQHSLQENGYANKEEWKEDWRDKRSNSLSCIGSSDETAGCQICVILPQEDGTYNLRLRLPEGIGKSLEAKHGKYVLIKGLKFNDGKPFLEAAINANIERKQAEKQYNKDLKAYNLTENSKLESYIAKKVALNGLGQPITYTFVRDSKYTKTYIPRKKVRFKRKKKGKLRKSKTTNKKGVVKRKLSKNYKGWKIILTTKRLVAPEIVTSHKNGAFGLDFNNGFISLAQIDKQGNKVLTKDIYYRKEDSTSKQNDTQMQSIAKYIVLEALELKIPICIEDLDFKNAKAQIIKGYSPGFNRILSTLSYRAFRSAIERNCAIYGVECIAVSPKYTSFLGEIKYLNETGSIHKAAALCIGRRGLGFNETLGKTRRKTGKIDFKIDTSKKIYTFNIPEDLLEDLYRLRSWREYTKAVQDLKEGFANYVKTTKDRQVLFERSVLCEGVEIVNPSG